MYIIFIHKNIFGLQRATFSYLYIHKYIYMHMYIHSIWILYMHSNWFNRCACFEITQIRKEFAIRKFVVLGKFLIFSRWRRFTFCIKSMVIWKHTCSVYRFSINNTGILYTGFHTGHYLNNLCDMSNSYSLKSRWKLCLKACITIQWNKFFYCKSW